MKVIVSVLFLFSLCVSTLASNDRIIEKMDSFTVEYFSCLVGHDDQASYAFRQNQLQKDDYKIIVNFNSKKQIIMMNDRLLRTCDNVKVVYKSK